MVAIQAEFRPPAEGLAYTYNTLNHIESGCQAP